MASNLPLSEQAERLISAGCRISGRAISERPRYPSTRKRQMPYRVVAFTEQEVDTAALGFEPDTFSYSGAELIHLPYRSGSQLPGPHRRRRR